MTNRMRHTITMAIDCAKDADAQARWPRPRGAAALAALAALALPPALTAGGNEVVTALVARAAEKNAAFMQGDMERWGRAVRIAPDFTLMQPFGGEASHGFDMRPERLAEMSRYFRSGTTRLEVQQTLASDDLVVLVMIERQTAEVGGLPAQDWSLRVTEVYRRAGADWELVHRHADPLVRRRTLEEAAVIARGAPVK